jgi:hypothetical protein
MTGTPLPDFGFADSRALFINCSWISFSVGSLRFNGGTTDYSLKIRRSTLSLRKNANGVQEGREK